MKIVELRNQNIQARPIPPAENNGEEGYEIAFIDRVSADVIHIKFSREVRDMLIAQLHGSGLVVADRMPTQ